MGLSVGQAILIGLVLTRILAMVLIAPVLGSRVVPFRFRFMLAAAISLLVAPVFIEAELASQISPFQLAALLMGELAIGLVFGLSLKLIFTAVDLAGRQFAGLCGTQFPGLPDGISGEAGPPIASLYGMISILIFLVIGGHRRVVGGLLDSFHQMPPGQDHLAIEFLPLLTGMLSQSFEFAVRLGAPIVLATLLALLVLGIASRGLPHFNLMQSSFTINSVLTLLMMIATVGTVEVLISTQQDQMQVWMNQLFSAGESVSSIATR